MLVPRGDFALSESFIDGYQDMEPAWGALGEVVFRRSYSAQKPDGSSEEWYETCRRVVEATYQIQKGHCQRFHLPWSDEKAQRSAQEMYERMFRFKFLPPGRGIAKMGNPVMWEKGSGCLFNCAFMSTANIGNTYISNAFSSPFTWLMQMSMLGVGVGFDSRGAGKVTLLPERSDPRPFVVQDSREGWAELLGAVLESMVDPSVPRPTPDYSKVRPKGAIIKTFGGTASGPEALELMVGRLEKLYRLYAGRPVDSRFIVDVCNSVGACVVSGGVRRTALISFGDPSDKEFFELKNFHKNEDARLKLVDDPDLSRFAENEHQPLWPRWAANNSVYVDDRTDFTKLVSSTIVNGEPGYMFLENSRKYGRMVDPPNWVDGNVSGMNPCGEITLHDRETCNLVETFPSRHDTYGDFQRTLKFAYLYSKTVTLIPTESAETNAVTLKNRRIGCSQSGIQDAIAKVGVRNYIRWCNYGYGYIQRLDKIYSDWLCIPRSIKTTTIKPSGSVSKIVGVREGLHESKGEYEFQTMRLNSASPLLPALARAGHRIVDDPDANNTKVVYFANHYPRTRSRQPTMWEQLELASLMQRYWADNAVSVTIDFDPETEGPEITRALEMYADKLKGVSFLPRNDHGYDHAPKQVISKEEYEAYVSQLSHVDFSKTGHMREAEDKFCDGGLCELPIKDE